MKTFCPHFANTKLWIQNTQKCYKFIAFSTAAAAATTKIFDISNKKNRQTDAVQKCNSQQQYNINKCQFLEHNVWIYFVVVGVVWCCCCFAVALATIETLLSTKLKTLGVANNWLMLTVNNVHSRCGTSKASTAAINPSLSPCHHSPEQIGTHGMEIIDIRI